MPRRSNRRHIVRAFTLTGLALAVIAIGAPDSAQAQAIRDVPGFRQQVLPRNDDESTGATPIGFTLNFFGRRYTNVFVNNNGNLTFQESLSTYVPFGLRDTTVPIIAAFFADVDTRNPATAAVTYGSGQVDGRQAFGVNYFRVGYYNSRADRLNNFQIVLISRADTGADNFDIEFNYGNMAWDLGEARGASQLTAVVGFSNGAREPTSAIELPGSLQAGALLDGGPHSLLRGRYNSNVAGRYVFAVRSGALRILRITTDSLPNGHVDTPYTAPPLNATGGVGPYTWSAVDWPTGLGLTLGPNGVISGTPTRTGAVDVTVKVVDQADGASTTKTFRLEIQAAVVPPPPPASLDYDGPATMLIDFGSFTIPNRVCRPLDLPRRQEGIVPFDFRPLKSLPGDHRLTVGSGTITQQIGRGTVALTSGDQVELCLDAGAWAPSSMAQGEPWIQIAATTRGQSRNLAVVQLKWNVAGLSFWQRWTWLFILIALLLLVLFILYGYIKPHRFPRSFALTFVPAYEDLDASAEPLAQWRGVGIGFYRDAEAFLRPDFRVSGKRRGALVRLKAAAGGIVLISPIGQTLYREIDPLEWEEVPADGRPMRPAVIYRIGDTGPFVRASSGSRRA